MLPEGIDVSLYQAVTPPLAGLDFVFVKATQGLGITDPRWSQHAAAVRAAGLILGAYHYWEDSPGADQAAHFLGVGGSADLLAIDVEGTGSSSPAAQVEVRDFIAAVHAAGRLVGLYHSEAGYPDLGQDFRWVAHWGVPAPAIAWDFHQYQGAPLDRDRWHSDLASLQALAAGHYGGTTVAFYEATAVTGTVKVAAGIGVTGLTPGDPWTAVKKATGPFTAHYDQRMHRIAGTTLPTFAVRCIDGPVAGLYIGLGGANVAATDDPPPVCHSDAELATAKQAGFDQAKAQAIAAVQGI